MQKPESITTCDNYLWNGITYSQSGMYIDTLQATLQKAIGIR